MRVSRSSASSVGCFVKSILLLRLLTCVLLTFFIPQLASALVINKSAATISNSSALRVSRGRDNVQLSESKTGTNLVKRGGNARFTFYDTGLGACGGWNMPTDFIVALNEQQWDGGSHCWEQITIEYGGKSTQAQIVDMCPGCPWGALDLSPGLFSFFADQDLGIIYGTWEYLTGQAPPAAPPPPTPSPLPLPPPPPPLSPPPLPLPPVPSPPVPPPPEPQSQQLQPQPQPSASFSPSPSAPQSLETTQPTSISVSTASSTSVSTIATPALQSTEVVPLIPLPTQDARSDDGGKHESTPEEDTDDPEPLFYQYLTNGDAEANNLQALNLAVINMIITVVHGSQDATDTPSSDSPTSATAI